MSNRVLCINKTDRPNPWERIRRLGGTRDDNGNTWRCSQEECIDHIKRGVTFYVLRNGSRAKLVVAKSQYGNEYVKTEADRTPQDNLLALPECT